MKRKLYAILIWVYTVLTLIATNHNINWLVYILFFSSITIAISELLNNKQWETK